MFIFLSVCSLLVPLSMIILGYTWKDKPPKDRQGSSGYRTTMSRMNDETWRYAHMLLYELTFPIILLGITILFALPNKSKTVMIWSILLYIGTPSILSYFYCRKRH